MTMFTLHLPLAVFSFSIKGDNYFALFWRLCTHFFQENKTANSCLLSKNSEQACSSQIWNERDAFACFGELRLVISHRAIPITEALK